MKTHILKLFLIWVFCLLLSVNVLADEEPVEEVLLSMVDPQGDELGPGTYTYPLHKHFEPYKGLFDLTQFELVKVGEVYRLEFVFVDLPDPWRAEYGFSHPLIQIYIDNEPGGDTELFKPGANVKLDPEAKWDVMLQITGWWVRLFHPTDRDKLNSTEIYWNDAENPFDLAAAVVKRVEANRIRIELPADALGTLSGARIFVLVGSFYAFGFDHYRDITPKSSDWSFGGGLNPNLYPRVLDLLLPLGMQQSEVLQLPEGAEEFVTIPYIRVGGNAGQGLDERTLIWLTAFVVMLALGVIILKKSKKNPIRS